MILYGQNESLSDWVSLNVLGVIGLYDKTSKAIGHMKDDKLVAAVTYNNFSTRPDGSFLTVELGIFSTEKTWATKEFLRAVFQYPFIQLGMERVETMCSAEKKDVIAFNKKLGFVPEGYHRQAWPMGGDAISFGMLREDCKWIRKSSKMKEVVNG